MSEIFRQNFSSLKKVGSLKNLALEEICHKSNLSLNQVDFYMNYFPNLDEHIIDLLEEYSSELDLEIIKFICLQPDSFREILICNTEQIINSDNPYIKVIELINEMKDPDKLDQIEDNFLNTVSKYIIERGTFENPFNSKFANFLKSISKKKIHDLTPAQLKWLKNVIKEDQGKEPGSRYFSNDYLRRRGFEKSCIIIDNYHES
jgi:hypothetical protein